MKNRKGFSYMEMVIALSLFSILIIAALPLLHQAGRNLAFAQDGHNAHLAAQSIMLAVRDAKSEAGQNQTPPQAVATAYAARLGVETYSVWIFSANAATITFGSDCAPLAEASLTGLSTMSITGSTSVIVVTVWNDYDNPIGRAIGVLR